MSKTVIKIENLSKIYHLGEIGRGTLRNELQSFWAKIRGKEDPNSKIFSEEQADRIQNNKFYALENINLIIKKGEVLGIIGLNGCGKSTLLKIISRVTTPSTGTIYSNGRIACLLEVGTGFHAELSGRENIFMNGAILGMQKKEIEGKFDEIVDFSGVSKFIDTPVKRYSSGMYIRLAFSVAVHLEPEILIVDEVLAVGDAIFQEKALSKMKNLMKGENGRTVLIVSHSMDSIKNFCSRVIVLSKGKILFDGDCNDGINFYEKEVVGKE